MSRMSGEVKMKFISWNVNGLRAATKKGFLDFFHGESADIFGIQETKMQENQKEFDIERYEEYWNCADKKGYSGTLIYTKHKPIGVLFGIDGKYSDEGRLVTLEYEDFYFVTIYSPNAQEALKRIEYRMQFEDDLRAYLLQLKQQKGVVVCGDLNVAHTEIDLKNPKRNEKNPGYSIQERTKFQSLLDEGFIDTFRYMHPEEVKYSWWSYRFNARKNNAGWRIDYFLVSDDLKERIVKADILTEVFGSDHCPVLLELDL